MLSVLLPPEGRGALLAGSFTRFWRFTIVQPYKVFPVVGRLSGLSARRSPVEAMRSVGFFVAQTVKERRSFHCWPCCRA